MAEKLATDATLSGILQALTTQNDYLANLQGRLSALNTQDKTSLIAALNEVLGQLGIVGSLNTSAKANAVAALNEIYGYSKVLQESGGAGLHNSIFRGKNLGTALTAAQSAAIRAGTFEDVWVGDSWTITVPAYTWTDSGGTVHNEASVTVTFRVADCDYYLKSGDQGNGLTTHHVVVIPDTVLYTARMNATDTTDGGYVGSEMYTNNLRRAKALFTAAFGSGHILTHRDVLVNAVKDGKASGGAWLDNTVELMTEQMVYGGLIFDSSAPDGSGGTKVNESFYRYTVSKSQLSLFRLRQDMTIAGSGSSRAWYWLRNIVSGACFADVSHLGHANCTPASNSGGGVRPAALIY